MTPADCLAAVRIRPTRGKGIVPFPVLDWILSTKQLAREFPGHSIHMLAVALHSVADG